MSKVVPESANHSPRYARGHFTVFHPEPVWPLPQ
jgi:hypothetical protein